MKHYIISMPLYKHDKVDTRCKECNAEFKNFKALQIHSKEEHQKMVYNLKRCQICEKEMKSVNMKAHWETHKTGQKYFPCTSCTFVTHDHSKLKSHKSWAHKYVVCLICSRSFQCFNLLQTQVSSKLPFPLCSVAECFCRMQFDPLNYKQIYLQNKFI
jgi:hypothetical protein